MMPSRHPSSLFASALLLAVPAAAPAQTESGIENRNPFLGNYEIASSAEIVMVTGGGTLFQTIYDYDGSLVAAPEQSQPGASSGGTAPEVVTGDFDGDRDDDVVMIYPGAIPPNPPRHRPLHLLTPDVNAGGFDWAGTTVTTVRDKLAEGFTQSPRGAVGHFDEDDDEEFVIAYFAADGRIRITVFDTGGTLVPRPVASIADVEHSLADLGSGARFDLSVGDLDGDGLAELVLAGVAADVDGAGSWGVFVRTYDFDASRPASSAIRPRGHVIVYDQSMTPSPATYDVNRVAVTTGNLAGTARHEILVGFQITQGAGSGDVSTTLLQPLTTDLDLRALVFDPDDLVQHRTLSGGGGFPMSLVAADFQGDGRDDIFALGLGTLAIYEPDDQLGLTVRRTVPVTHNSGHESHRAVQVVDLDARVRSTAWSPELIVANDVGGSLQLSVYSTEVDSLGAWQTRLQDQVSTSRSFSTSALGVADFDADAVRLGTPRITTSTDIVQPIVVLNAPPTHFDVFDGVAHDVNVCFGDDDCSFEARYDEGISAAKQVSTTVNADWALDTKLFSVNELAGNKFNSSLELSVGANFSNAELREETITVGVDVRAVHDDMVYATVADYDFWEYPVYGDGGSNPVGHIVAVVPRITENRWFPVKSWSGGFFHPNHEVGNILSYTEDIPQNNDILERIKGTTFNSYVLGPHTDYEWTLEFSDFQESRASETFSYGHEINNLIQIGVAADVSAEPLGVGVSSSFEIGFGIEVEQRFDVERTTTHTTSVRKDLLLGVAMGSVQDAEKAYIVKPYAYWSNYGALVVDYVCWPEVAGPGHSGNWWQDTYGVLPDPAIAMPWRHDRAKGFDLLDEDKRSLTRDILFHPKDPKPGQLVTIVTRVHNLSLLPTPGIVDLRFYLGDPDAGGEQLVSPRGARETGVPIIEPRGRAVVTFEWLVPPDVERHARIYAVLDPENRYDEVHEDNNKAWTTLGARPEEALRALDTSGAVVRVLRSYPNPFRPGTTISYAVTRHADARLRIYNVQGALVRTLKEGLHAPGTHRAHWDGTDASGRPVGGGVYFYEVRSGEAAASGKVIRLN